jgi:hypothetical protein
MSSNDEYQKKVLKYVRSRLTDVAEGLSMKNKTFHRPANAIADDEDLAALDKLMSN